MSKVYLYTNKRHSGILGRCQKHPRGGGCTNLAPFGRRMLTPLEVVIKYSNSVSAFSCCCNCIPCLIYSVMYSSVRSHGELAGRECVGRNSSEPLIDDTGDDLKVRIKQQDFPLVTWFYRLGFFRLASKYHERCLL